MRVDSDLVTSYECFVSRVVSDSRSNTHVLRFCLGAQALLSGYGFDSHGYPYSLTFQRVVLLLSSTFITYCCLPHFFVCFCF